MARNSRRAAPPSPAADEAPPGLTPRALTKQEFGRRLYDLMVKRNMNQSDLARASRLGRDSISTYIRGTCFPTPKSLKALADVFRMEPHEIMPNAMQAAIDSEIPALEIRQAQGHPDKVWLRVNQLVDMRTASKVFDALNPKDADRR